MPIKLPPTPDNYEDPLGLLDPDLVPAPEARPVAIPTGLSDEADAARHLHLKFGEAVMCWNCETVYEKDAGHYCPRCHHELLPPAQAIERGAHRKKRFGA